MTKIDLYAEYGIERNKNRNGFLEKVGGNGNLAVVICPGGSYVFLSDSEKYNVAERFISLGFTAYVLHYSVFPTKFPYPYIEVACAIDHIKKTEPCKKVVVLGFSAGGHLAGMSGVLHNKTLAKEAFNSLCSRDFDSLDIRPDGVIMCYPVVSFDRKIRHHHSFRCLCGRDKTLKNYLSLENLVDAQTPPTFLWHTKQDIGVSYKNSEVFHQKLLDNGILSRLVIFEKGGHGLSLGDNFPHVASWTQSCVEFFSEVFL